MTTAPEPHPDLVIWDCDGVLVDSEAIVIEIEAELLTTAGFPMSVDDVADRCVGLSYPDMMATLEAEFGRPVPPELSDRIQADALAAFPDRLQPVAGVTDVLSDLRLPKCVASSSNLDRIQLSLELTGLDRFFDPDHLFSAQMVENGKPAPDLFLHAARAMSVEPDRCLVIEDSPHGVEAALAGGMQVIGFVGGLHARPALQQRLRDAGAPRIAQRTSELLVF